MVALALVEDLASNARRIDSVPLSSPRATAHSSHVENYETFGELRDFC